MTFHLTVMPNAERDYLELLMSAKDRDLAIEIRRAFRDALRRLKVNAATAGEPLYDLKQMRMRVCRLIVDPLYVEFGVHFDQPSVFIRRVVLLR